MNADIQNPKYARRTVTLAVALAVGTAVLTAGPARAQNVTATIRGDVTLGRAAGPVVATVVAANVATGAETRVTTGPDGSYVMTGLPPGEYLVTVTTASGDTVPRLVAVEIGKTVEIDLDLEREGLDLASGETIVVLGRLAEARTSEVATNISQEQMDNLPQNNRNFLDFAALAPGVRVSDRERGKNFSSGALEASQTNVFIDGVSLKNNVIDGGVVGQDSSRGNPFPQLAIAGFRVLTQNFKAEYEQAGSAIISAITRSGGNEFEGEVFTSFQNKALVATDFFTLERDDPKPEYARYQFGGSVSGPIVKDKLHFFASYEGNAQNRANQVTLGSSTPENMAQFGEYEGSFVSPFREHLAFGKLTWRPTRDHTVDLSASVRRETDIRSFGGEISYENAENVRNNVLTTALRHQWRLGRMVNEATAQFLDTQFNPTVLEPDLVGLEYQGVIRIGGRDTSQDIGQQSFTVRDDLSFPDIEAAGRHLVKTGVKVAYQRYHVVRSLFGNPIFRFREDPANNLDFEAPFEAQYGVGNPRVESDNLQLGLYAQDDWQIGSRLILNLGMRWDVESNPLNNDHVTPDDVREAVTQLAAMPEIQANGSDFFDVDNYITDGNQRPIFLAAIQPRLGASYDLFGDQKTVLFGGAGRYYDRTLFNTGVDEKYRLQYEVRTFRFSPDGADRDGLPTIMWDPSYRSAEGLDRLIENGTAPAPEIFLLENDTRPLHTDQFSIGARQQISAFNASVTLSHSRSENGLGFYPANRLATGNRDFIPTPNGFGNVIISADDRSSRYTALYITVEKPFSDALSRPGIPWGMSVAYTLGYARDRGQLFNFDYPTIKDSPFEPTVTDERQRLVLSGIVGLPLDFKVSTLITLGSGLPFTITDATDGFGPQEIVILRNGGRADGFFQYKQVDLRVAKDFHVYQNQRVTAFVEAFNIFNFKNFAEYNGFIPPADAEPNPDFGEPSRIIGPTFSLQVGLGYRY